MKRSTIVHQLRSLYRRLPVSQAVKIAAVHWAFEHLPWLFRNAPEYKRWLVSRAMHVPYVPPVLAAIAKPIQKESPDFARAIFFAPEAVPQVSVIVPASGKIAHTLHCLRAIQESNTAIAFEIIVIDDCSKDATADYLALVRGIRVVRNDTNLGFLHSCNKGASLARGAYLLFLNNATQVHPGWMDALHTTFIDYPQAGLVGSKLVYPNGRLQEAGGMNYGREGDPLQPEYNFLRDVDYCSGASSMVPRALFEQIGGFDTNLALAVRREGYRVLYQPFSTVIHYEGITSGTSINADQQANQQKVQRRALVTDVTTPRPDRDSGSIDTFQYIRLLQTLGFKVVFFPDDLRHDGRYTEALQKIGVECLYLPYVRSLRSHLDKHGAHYDLVLIQRAHSAAQHIDLVRRKCANARVLFNTVDLHFLREQRQAETEQSTQLAEQARRTKALELGVMRKSDATIVISEAERVLLQKEAPDLRIAAIPYVREVHGSAASFQQRRDLVFIGGFLFDPNVDALKYFAEEIWPLIRVQLPELRLLVVGSGMVPEVISIGRIPGIEILGFVENITPIFSRCRLSIAPLRYGAGIKGKVGTSIRHGVPCVATPVAAEGMGLQDRVNVMIGRDAAAFAAAVIEAYQDEVLWDELSANGLKLFEEHYSFARGLQRLGAVLTDVKIPGF